MCCRWLLVVLVCAYCFFQSNGNGSWTTNKKTFNIFIFVKQMAALTSIRNHFCWFSIFVFIFLLLCFHVTTHSLPGLHHKILYFYHQLQKCILIFWVKTKEKTTCVGHDDLYKQRFDHFSAVHVQFYNQICLLCEAVLLVEKLSRPMLCLIKDTLLLSFLMMKVIDFVLPK